MIKIDKDDVSDIIKLNRLSKIFEARLFGFAPSLCAYSDQFNLESRIRILAMQLGKKIEKSQQGYKICLHRNKGRQDVLESKLGKPNVEMIVEIIEKVKNIRRHGFYAFRSRVERQNGRKACAGAEGSYHIPIAVRNIYFSTRLVEAFFQTHSAKTEEALSAHVDSVQWIALIDEAKHNIHNFEMWERSQEAR